MVLSRHAGALTAAAPDSPSAAAAIVLYLRRSCMPADCDGGGVSRQNWQFSRRAPGLAVGGHLAILYFGT